MEDVWTSVLHRIGRRIGPKSFRDWFEPTRLHSLDEAQALIEVPNALFKEWMDRNYCTVVEEDLLKGSCCRQTFGIASVTG